MSFGAARETRTLMDKVHTALNRACLPISAWPQYNMTHIKSMTRRFQIDKFNYGI